MDIFGMLIWVVVLVTLVVFIVLLVKRFKTLGVLNTILLSILFIECWTFIFFAGSVTYQRVLYTKVHDALMEKANKLTETLDLELYGDRREPVLNLEKFVPLSNEVNRIAVERGRVWRGARRMPPAAAGAITLQLPANVSNLPVGVPPAAANAAGAAGAVVVNSVESGLEPSSVVYMFGESRSPTVGLIPTVYLGEYFVMENKLGQISVRPTAELSELQQELIVKGINETWAVYEVMPVDSHAAFAAEGSKVEVDAIFGRMDKVQIAELFGLPPALADANPATLDNKLAAKYRLIMSYLNDGGRAPEQTPSEALAYQVTFLKDHSEAVNSDESRKATEGGYFDAQGRTVDARMKLDSEKGVVFKSGETYVFDAATSKDWEKLGIVSLGTKLFVRPLNDYEFAFREVRRLRERARQDTLLNVRNLAEINRTIGVAAEDEVKQTEQGRRLGLDLAQYTKELEVINSVHDSLTKQIDEKKAELGRIYAAIVSLHNQLLQRTGQLTQ